MWFALWIAGWLAMAPGPWATLVKIWDGAHRAHTWVTLKVMGFQQGPEAKTVADDQPMAALPEEKVHTVDRVDAEPSDEPTDAPEEGASRVATLETDDAADRETPKPAPKNLEKNPWFVP